ncbi:cobalamin biosynthesis protein CobD [Gemmobacter lanyuensis]|uniref:Cobalamin biosynthesis protein CobD n=1 Tax=Gemmobacter lanyuensis TaxID=1054497 RepID=A0A918MLM2_9RHOB|nr:adenosylcobinamide-phosphate synthase CbiB [Gemmobacter lanyuensis]GGW33898.1 cobalamin biosynthesis protein CobD [Gemmobacter lanyuensis]
MSALILVPAMLLDAALGEPKWLWDRFPHPAVLMGRAVSAADKALNTGGMRRLKGFIAMTGLGLAALALGWLLHVLPDFGVLEVIVVAILLAQKSLVEHVRAVAEGLRQSLADGRRKVAMIVGRDTAAMEGPAVARAAIESAAENLSDGVIAPLFWYLVAGLPGLMLYKITNTADSMIGHRTPRHEQFGWAAARFDDLLNLIPARLTALLLALAHGRLDAARVILRDAPLHRSPNAGWPEAAMAVVLGISLSGPRSYNGEMRDFPWVNAEGRRDPGPAEIEAACSALWRAWGLMLAFALLMVML